VSAQVLARMHKDTHGVWADSADIPGYTAVADDPLGLMELVTDAADRGMLGQDVDLRWEFHGKHGRGVVAIRAPWLPADDLSPQLCPCAYGEVR
jgi:hypothetical protein